MNCPQCQELIRASDKYCSQCGCDLETGRQLPAVVKDVDKALVQLEERLQGKKNKLMVATQNDGVVLFRTGMVLAALFLAHFVVKLLPYDYAFASIILWADRILLTLQMIVPAWMAWQIPNPKFKTTLMAVGLLAFLLGLYRIFF